MKRYVFGKSVKGAIHEKNGLPLQDNCKIEEISDKITIIAVADGHGSSKCPRSDRGSLIAVNTFCTVMKNYLLNYGKEKDGLTNLVTFLNREGDMRFAQDIQESEKNDYIAVSYEYSCMKGVFKKKNFRDELWKSFMSKQSFVLLDFL